MRVASAVHAEAPGRPTEEGDFSRAHPASAPPRHVDTRIRSSPRRTTIAADLEFASRIPDRVECTATPWKARPRWRYHPRLQFDETFAPLRLRRRMDWKRRRRRTTTTTGARLRPMVRNAKMNCNAPRTALVRGSRCTDSARLPSLKLSPSIAPCANSRVVIRTPSCGILYIRGGAYALRKLTNVSFSLNREIHLCCFILP